MIRISRYVPHGVVILAALASVAFAALPVMRHAAGVVVTEPVTGIILPDTTPAETVDLAPLFQRAPFGRQNQPDGTSTSATQALPTFALRGVFLSNGPSSAALLDVDGETGRFRLSEHVTEVFVLEDVAEDHVTLVGDGQSITLRFDEAELDTAEGEIEEAPAASPEDLIAQLGGGLVVPAAYQRPKPPETTSEYIDYWRTRIRKNPQAVLDEIGLTATDAGYVIADRHDVGVRLAGLKAGDLVRSVNGQAVGNPDDDRGFYDQIAASGQARLEVERNGRVLTFSFPLR